MNRGLIGAIAGVLMVTALTVAMFTMYRAVETRTALAHSWSNDDFNFTATGSFTRTLTVEPIGYDAAQKPIACSLFIGSVTRDRKLSRELVDAGFNQMECDGQFGDLHQNLR